MILKPETLANMIRRHAHDIRNHCSGIDLDATLVAELSEDVETTAAAVRLKKQVARIEADLKLLLVKLEKPNPVSLTVADLLQLWKRKLGRFEHGAITVIWPPELAFPPIMLDPRLVVPLFCDLTFRLCEGQRGNSLEIAVRQQDFRIRISVITTMDHLPLPQDYLEEAGTLLEAGGIVAKSAFDPANGCWTFNFDVPCFPQPET